MRQLQPAERDDLGTAIGLDGEHLLEQVVAGVDRVRAARRVGVGARVGCLLGRRREGRQDDRDRVQIEQDRQRAERNLNDTEYLAREVVALRLAMKDVASKDFIRAELRSLLEELNKDDSDKDPDRVD